MIRRATPHDLGQITYVRTSVIENHLSVAEMAERGITHDTLTASMNSGALAAWVAEADGKIVAFSMANKMAGRVFALFTLPTHEGKGLGSLLLQRCEDWLRENGVRQAGVDTGRGTRAQQFYIERGWQEDAILSTADEIELVKELTVNPQQLRRR
jgi:GNAT superfamily N-acetyltransferase